MGVRVRACSQTFPAERKTHVVIPKSRPATIPRSGSVRVAFQTKEWGGDERLTPPSWGRVAEASEAAASAPRASRATIIFTELLGE